MKKSSVFFLVSTLLSLVLWAILLIKQQNKWLVLAVCIALLASIVLYFIFKKRDQPKTQNEPIDSVVRRILYNYFSETYFPMLTITNIKTTIENNIIVVEIETHKPGVLIGPKGETLDSIVLHLNKVLEQETQVRIKECTLWTKFNSFM